MIVYVNGCLLLHDPVENDLVFFYLYSVTTTVIINLPQ